MSLWYFFALFYFIFFVITTNSCNYFKSIVENQFANLHNLMKYLFNKDNNISNKTFFTIKSYGISRLQFPINSFKDLNDKQIN